MPKAARQDPQQLRRITRRFRLLTHDEAARLLGVPPRTVEQMRRLGEIDDAVYKVGKHIRYCPKLLKRACSAVCEPQKEPPRKRFYIPVPLLSEANAAALILQVPPATLAKLRKQGRVAGAWVFVRKHIRYRALRLKQCFSPDEAWLEDSDAPCRIRKSK